VGEVMVPDDWTVDPNACNQYYFKITSSARQDNNAVYPVKIVRSLGATPANVASLALNGKVQSRTNTAGAYSDIRAMIEDYVYDFINGHTADKFSSGCTEQRPMKFS